MALAIRTYIDQAIATVRPHIERVLTLYRGLSPREKNLLLIGTAVMFLIVAMIVVRPISSRFNEQSLRLAAASADAAAIRDEMVRYLRLKQRRAEVEQEFKSVEIKEGALSYIEGLLRSKAGIDQGAFTIKDQPPKPFGTEYQQTSFSVSFTTTDYPHLIDFLQELVDGPKPLMVKKLDLKKSRSGDKLEVELEVSSIAKEAK